MYYCVDTPDLDLIVSAAVLREPEDTVIVKEEGQYLSPELVLVLRVLFAGNSAFVVSPLLLTNSGVDGPKRFNVGNKMSTAGTTTSALNVDAVELCAEFPVTPRILDGVKALDVVEKLGCRNLHRPWAELDRDAQRAVYTLAGVYFADCRCITLNIIA